MEPGTPLCQHDVVASKLATSDSDKPMEIESDEQKKRTRVPNNVAIKENSSNNGSPETGTLEQK